MPLLLASMEPLATSPEEFQKTKQLLVEFAQNQGPRLQKALEEQANACRAQVAKFMDQERSSPEQVQPGTHPDGSPFPNVHFLEALWEQVAYLAYQDSIVCYSNVFTSMFESKGCPDRVLRAAWVTMGLLDFAEQILSGELAGEKGQCASQYLKIMFTTRVPGLESDRVVTRPVPLKGPFNGSAKAEKRGPWDDREELTRPHICVTSTKGHFYEIDCADVTTEEIYLALQYIENDLAGRKEASTKLTDLTGGKRDHWYRARVRLMASSTHSAESLKSLEEAIFHLVWSDLEPKDAREVMLGLQEGRGAWLDKSASIMIFANGCCGANLEHAAADAVVSSRMLVHANDFAIRNEPRVLGMTRDKYMDAAKTKVRSMAFNETLSGEKKSPRSLSSMCRALTFDIDPIVVEETEIAKKVLEDIFEDNKTAVVTCTDMGANQIKKCGMGPDTFMQVAIQLAYGLDQQGAVPPTYETATTRAFLHGRTECIRSQSSHSKKLVELVRSGSASPAELKKAAIEAGKAHRWYITLSSKGRGADRHMLMLRVLASKLGEELHPIYNDPLFVRAGSFELSTSQLPWACQDHVGFGAPFPNAYGACYRFMPDEIVVFVSARERSCPSKNAQRFARRIDLAIHQLVQILSHPDDAKL